MSKRCPTAVQRRMEEPMEVIDVKAAREYVMGNYPNDPLLKHIAVSLLEQLPKVEAVEAEKYKALVEMYHDLRENFIDYYCSGEQNVAPYCLNKCEECVDKWGYCKQYSDHCKGFNPAEVILDDVKMDGDGNG